LPGVRKTAAETPESEGAGVALAQGRLEATKAAGSAQVAGAAANFGERAAAIGMSVYAQMRDEERKAAEDTIDLKNENLLSAWKSDRIYNEDHGALTVEGEASFPLPEQVLDDFDKRVDEISSTLSTPEQKLRFAQTAARTRQEVDLLVLRHVFAEKRKFHANELDGFVKNAENEAIQSAAEPRAVAIKLQDGELAIRRNGPALGLGPQAVEAKVAEFQSNIHVGVIRNLAASKNPDDVQKARDYFEVAQSQIAGDQQDGIKRLLQSGDERVLAQKTFDEVWAKGIAAGKTEDDMTAEVTATLKGDARDQALAYVEHAWAKKREATRQDEEDQVAKAYDIVYRTHDVRNVPTTILSQLGPHLSPLYDFAKRLTDKTGLDPDKETANFYRLIDMAGTNPDRFAAYNLAGEIPNLERPHFDHLATIQRSLRENDRASADKALAPFLTRDQIFKNTLVEAGRIIGITDLEAATLQRELARRVEQWETDTGKRAPNEQVQAIMDSLVMKVVLTPTHPATGGFLGIGGTPGQPAVTKRVADVTIGDIPPADRALIEAKLRAQQPPIPVTPDSVVYYYLRVKRLMGDVKFSGEIK
jgi:hypothetical protein